MHLDLQLLDELSVFWAPAEYSYLFMLRHEFSSSVTSTLFYTDVAIKHIHGPQVFNPKNKSVAVPISHTVVDKYTFVVHIFIPVKDKYVHLMQNKQPCFIVIKRTC